MVVSDRMEEKIVLQLSYIHLESLEIEVDDPDKCSIIDLFVDLLEGAAKKGMILPKEPSKVAKQSSRTISLCTGMQSSTVAGLLATQFLQSSQAVPPACSVVAMAIMGLCLASFWGTGLRLRDLPFLIFSPPGSTVEA